MTEDVLAKFVDAARVGFFVDAVDGLLILAHQPRGHGFVGEQHVFLDQLMRNVVLDLFNAQDTALFVEADLGFGKIQRERTVLEAQAADLLGEFVGVVQHALDGIIRWRLLQDGEHFLVGEAALRVDDGGIKLSAQHAAIVRDEKLHALGEAIHIGFERAEFVTQGFGQHRYDAVHEIGGVAAFARLDIQGRAGLHVMRHVGDVDPKLPLILRGSFQRDGIIEIFRVVGINRDDLMRTAIFPSGDFMLGNSRANSAGLSEHRLGKVQRQVVLTQHREHVHAFLVRRTEHFDDFTFRICVARLPFLQLDHDLVADVRLATDITRLRHINIVRHARIIGPDVEELPAALQRADDLRALTFEDADDRTGFLLHAAIRS